MRPASYLLINGGKASMESLAMSVFRNPRKWFNTLPLTLITYLAVSQGDRVLPMVHFAFAGQTVNVKTKFSS